MGPCGPSGAAPGTRWPTQGRARRLEWAHTRDCGTRQQWPPEARGALDAWVDDRGQTRAIRAGCSRAISTRRRCCSGAACVPAKRWCPSVAIVGTRRCTPTGTVGGGGVGGGPGRGRGDGGVGARALGIDGAAHRGALSAEGAPVAGVVGSGHRCGVPAGQPRSLCRTRWAQAGTLAQRSAPGRRAGAVGGSRPAIVCSPRWPMWWWWWSPSGPGLPPDSLS